MFQITQQIVKTETQEIQIDWAMEDQNDQIVQKRTEKLAVKFVERQEGVKLQSLGNGRYCEQGAWPVNGIATFWQIEEV